VVAFAAEPGWRRVHIERRDGISTAAWHPTLQRWVLQRRSGRRLLAGHDDRLVLRCPRGVCIERAVLVEAAAEVGRVELRNDLLLSAWSDGVLRGVRLDGT